MGGPDATRSVRLAGPRPSPPRAGASASYHRMMRPPARGATRAQTEKPAPAPPRPRAAAPQAAACAEHGLALPPPMCLTRAGHLHPPHPCCPHPLNPPKPQPPNSQCLTRVRHHVVPHEPVAEQQLHLLVVVGAEVARVGGRVAVGTPPLVAAGSELVGGEGAAAGREAAGDADAALAVPGPGGWGGWVGWVGCGAGRRRKVGNREARRVQVDGWCVMAGGGRGRHESKLPLAAQGGYRRLQADPSPAHPPPTRRAAHSHARRRHKRRCRPAAANLQRRQRPRRGPLPCRQGSGGRGAERQVCERHGGVAGRHAVRVAHAQQRAALRRPWGSDEVLQPPRHRLCRDEPSQDGRLVHLPACAPEGGARDRGATGGAQLGGGRRGSATAWSPPLQCSPLQRASSRVMRWRTCAVAHLRARTREHCYRPHLRAYTLAACAHSSSTGSSDACARALPIRSPRA